MLQPKFNVGDKVKAKSFTDCFNKFQPEHTGLTVTDVRLITGQTTPDYYRVTAHEANGLGMIEGAERFFSPESPIVLTINGQKYAPSKSTFIESLFSSGGTYSGEYRVQTGGILLIDMAGTPFAFVVDRGRESWIVTAGRTTDGKTVYMQGLADHTAGKLGISEPGRYSASLRLAAAIISQVKG